MGKKKRGHPHIEDLLARPWCYYCERDFEDFKLLISHQKAKHFKCDRCGRRLNTAGGLSVHMNQVHKETLQVVENSLPNRQAPDVEIFGVEGIPSDILEQHRNRIIQTYYQAQEDRRIATGNPLPGQAGQNKRRNIKYETKEELLQRVLEWKVRKYAEREAAISGSGQTSEPATSLSAPQAHTSAQFGSSGSPIYPVPTPQLPSRPPVGHEAPGFLPQRPPGSAGGVAPQPQQPTAADAPDEIDQMIRQAEAGIKPARKTEEVPSEDKNKKERRVRMMYDDIDTSPEEKMVSMSRYRFDANTPQQN